MAKFVSLVTRPKYPPPYRETSVAIPLSHCVSCGIADYRCYTPTSVHKSGLSQSKDRPNKGVWQKKLASEAYRAIGGVARNSIANRAIAGHYHTKFVSQMSPVETPFKFDRVTPEMPAPILWAPGISVFFLQENLCPYNSSF